MSLVRSVELNELSHVLGQIMLVTALVVQLRREALKSGARKASRERAKTLLRKNDKSYVPPDIASGPKRIATPLETFNMLVFDGDATLTDTNMYYEFDDWDQPMPAEKEDMTDIAQTFDWW